MIPNNTFTEEWIQKISNDYKRGGKKADPTLIEKVTKALHLLENLSQTDLGFIFKGGTLYCYCWMKCIAFPLTLISSLKKQEGCRSECDFERGRRGESCI